MQFLHHLRHGYGASLAAAVPAFLVTLLVGAWGDRTAFALYLSAAVTAAYFGGLRAGLLATVLAVVGLVAQYHLLPTGPLRQPGDFWTGLLLFAVVGTLASFLSSECARAVATAGQLQRQREADLKELEDQISRQQQAAAELRRRHQEQIHEIESRLAGIQEAQGLLQEQLAEKQQAEQELRRRHAEEQREWEAAAERLREENAELERRQAEWKRAEETLRREVAEHQRAKQDADNALAELRRGEESRRAERETQHADWRQTEDKLRRQITDLNETTDLLEEELADWQQKEQQARAEKESLAHEHEELRAEHDAQGLRFEEERAEWRRSAGWIDRVAERLQPLALGVAEAVRSGASSVTTGQRVGQLTQFADALWAACRLARHELALRPEQAELGALLSRVVEAADALVRARGHHLTVKLPLGPLWLIADAPRLEQALLALLDNAARYTEPGGAIELDVEQQPDEVVFRVKDSGRGIAPEEMPAVLALDARARKFGDGLGLGLALVRGLVEEQGGQVEVASAGPGGGSEFRLRFQVVSAVPLAA